MTLTRTASTSAQALALELGITDTAKKAKAYDLILALLTLERERCAAYHDTKVAEIWNADPSEMSDAEKTEKGIAYSIHIMAASAIRRGEE